MRNKEIIEILHNIENKENVEILYACEAGSRAWGFANDKSDYDIRFLYKKTSIMDYLSIKNQSDVIEYQCGDLDIVGWDIKKSLKLHYKNNANLREWFISNHRYIDKGIESIFSGLGGFDIDILKNHYSAISKDQWKKYCSLEFTKKKTKKYLYVIRSILTWRLLNRDIYPPINIHDLLNHDFINIGDDVRIAINALIDYHQDAGELTEKTISKLNYFIVDSLSSMTTGRTKSFKDIEIYDERFRELLLVSK